MVATLRASALLACVAGGVLAQERPRQYCASTATLISGDEVCLSLLEYTVGSVQPNTVPLAGQLVRIIGTQFPTDGTNTMQCTVGGTVSASTLVKSATEVACLAPVAVAAGAVPISLALCDAAGANCGTPYVDVDVLQLTYEAVDPEELTFNGVSPLRWLAWGAWALVASGCLAGAVGTVCFLRRRSRAKDSLDLLSEFEPASDRYAQQWAGTKTRGGKEDRLDEALLQGEAADQSMVAGRAPKPCKCCYSQWCCLGYAIMGLVMLGSGITSVIFTNILLAEEEEGVASFKTLETPPAGVTPTAMTVSWSYPLDEEPPTNLQYDIQIRQADPGAGLRRRRRLQTEPVGEWATVYTGPDEQFTFTGLNTATRYGFRLRFVENSIASQWSTSAYFNTQATAVPDAPPMPTVIATTEDTISLQWAAPQTNGAAIDSPYYSVLRDPDAGEGWQDTLNPGVSTTVTALTAGASYDLHVRAHNVQGWGAASAALTATCNQAGATVPATPAAPTENDPASRRPTSVQLIVGDDSLPDAGAPILAFGLDVEGGAIAEYTRVFSGPGVQNVTVDNLEPETAYTFRVCAINSLGVSEFSTLLSLTTPQAGVPNKITSFTQTEIWLSRTRLRWERPASEGAAILRYELQMVASDSGEFKEFNFTADLLEADVPDALRAATRYSTQIRAVNSVGGGEWNNITVHTYNNGACSNDADALIWNENMPTFSTDIGTCCLSCLGLPACFRNCWINNLGYSPPCTDCWAETCSCSSFQCLEFCIGGPSAACDQCVIERCNPTTSACTGLPPDFIPRG